MSNLIEIHNLDKEISAVSLFKGELGTATAIQLERNGNLKEHISKTSALLLCVNGYVTYQDETEQEVKLESGDYVHIAPNVKHWLNASVKSQLILLK